MIKKLIAMLADGAELLWPGIENLLLTLSAFGGLGLVVAGVWWVFPPAALVVAGLLMVCLALLYVAAQRRPG